MNVNKWVPFACFSASSGHHKVGANPSVNVTLPVRATNAALFDQLKHDCLQQPNSHVFFNNPQATQFVPVLPNAVHQRSHLQALYDDADWHFTSYEKGDNATTVQGFCNAIQDDFQVEFNTVALDPEAFKSRIVIYGENHLDVKLPSIPNGKGVVLFEPSNLNRRCIEKYKRCRSNQCLSIDGEITKESQAAEKKLSSLADLLIELNTTFFDELLQKQKPAGSIHHFLVEGFYYAAENYEAIYSAKSFEGKKKLTTLYERLMTASDELTRALHEGLPARDAHMLNEAIRIIRSRSLEDGVTIVLGDSHVAHMFYGLKEYFPHRAIVLCRLKKQE